LIFVDTVSGERLCDTGESSRAIKEFKQRANVAEQRAKKLTQLLRMRIKS